MTSVIMKKHNMEDLFKKYPIDEVFARSPFSFEDDSPTLLVMIPTDCFNWYDLWIELLTCFPHGLLISIVRDYDDAILQDTQLIWKGGAWFV